MQLQSSSVSDIGKIRQNNEDSYLELKIDERDGYSLLLVVADGMGGHNAGEVASKTVVESIESYFKSEESNLNSDKTLSHLKESIEKANSAVIKASASDESLKGMGSTCTAIMILNNMTFVAHVGDSRAYLIRGKKINQITKDHTLAEKMLESGIITKEEAKTSPHRNMLMKAIGIEDKVEVETYDPFNVKPGDVYLLCSDGLTEYLEEEELCSIINIYEPQEACKLLVNIANKRGGKDNITVQIAKVMDLKAEENNDFMSNLKKNNSGNTN
ncbi:MAG: Stp1/IreP family PP2C-type Ser/Thr phosphatase [Thermodesulfobacteriota bacterium]